MDVSQVRWGLKQGKKIEAGMRNGMHLAHVYSDSFPRLPHLPRCLEDVEACSRTKINHRLALNHDP
jgi:hypothetical protein